MIYSQECSDCNRRITLDYDEDDGTPEFCPFCGVELSDDGEFNVKMGAEDVFDPFGDDEEF